MKQIVVFVLLFFIAPWVYATSIVVLVTPKYVLLGTDSRRTFLNAQSKVTGRQTVCKIRKSGKYCFALAGFVASGATSFSADSIVNNYLQNALDYNQAIDSITISIRTALQQDINFQKQFQPKVFQKTLASKDHILEVVILSVRNEAPYVQILGFELADEHLVQVKEYATTCPGDCPEQQVQFYLLGQYKGIEKYLYSNQPLNNPEVLVENLITAQAKTTPFSVSTPINMVKYTANGMEWIK